jgi:hypothetical protein
MNNNDSRAPHRLDLRRLFESRLQIHRLLCYIGTAWITKS